MTLTTNQTKMMEVHRIEMPASVVFDVLMPKAATVEEIRVKAALVYQNAVDDCDGFTLNCSLPNGRVYVATDDNLEPVEIEIADTMPIRRMKKTVEDESKGISFQVMPG